MVLVRRWFWFGNGGPIVMCLMWSNGLPLFSVLCSLFVGLCGSKKSWVGVWVFGLGCGSKQSWAWIEGWVWLFVGHPPPGSTLLIEFGLGWWWLVVPIWVWFVACFVVWFFICGLVCDLLVGFFEFEFFWVLIWLMLDSFVVWLMGFSEFEIFLFGLVVMYFWIDLVVWSFRIWWFCWVEKMVILKFLIFEF